MSSGKKSHTTGFNSSFCSLRTLHVPMIWVSRGILHPGESCVIERLDSDLHTVVFNNHDCIVSVVDFCFFCLICDSYILAGQPTR